MNILLACEESQAVCKEFRKKGHNAFSCDIQECSGSHPEWHIKDNVLPLLNGNCVFKTQDGVLHEINGKWDMIIAFPPCTDLAVSGAKHFEKKRKDGRQRKSIVFFLNFLLADCDKIAIENPVGIISGEYVREYFPDLCKEYGLPRKPDQIIQPYFFGDPHRKTTCLWLKNLPPLVSTNIVEPTLVKYTCKDGRQVTFDSSYMASAKKGERGKQRSKTFPGIAKATAEQWG